MNRYWIPIGDERLRRSPSGGVVQRLLKLMLDGNLHPGDRLPAERAMAEDLGVGRSAVREALSALEFLGFVETVGGSGTYLRAPSTELLPQALQWGMLLGHNQTAHLHRVRASLEVSAVEWATPRYTEKGLAELSAILDEQRQSMHDPAHFVEQDSAFHRHIAATAANPVLEDLLSSARSLLRLWVEKSVHAEADMCNALREHDKVLEALRHGEAANAAAAMRLHMMTAHARLVAATPGENDEDIGSTGQTQD